MPKNSVALRCRYCIGRVPTPFVLGFLASPNGAIRFFGAAYTYGMFGKKLSPANVSHVNVFEIYNGFFV
jgi:hypothetical protein